MNDLQNHNTPFLFVRFIDTGRPEVVFKPNEFGLLKLYINGYEYYRRDSKHRWYWNCKRYRSHGCHARARSDRGGENLKLLSLKHNHDLME